MAYQKPTVTVRQVQESVSPIFPNPTFESVVVGPGYYWQNPASTDSVYDEAKYVGEQLVIPISAFTDHSEVLEDTIIVELLRTKGSNGAPGEKTVLTKDTDFTYTTGNITINADLSGFDDSDSGATDEARVIVGFLSKNADINNEFERVSSLTDIRNLVGEAVTWNPLAFGANLMLTASGASTHIVGVAGESHADALAKLATKEVYAIAPLTSVSAQLDAYQTHVVAQSAPENKKERIVFVSESHDLDTVTAEDVKNSSASRGERRVISIYPPYGYIEETRHTASLKSSFIEAVFGETFTAKPRFIQAQEINGTYYKAFSEITDTAIADLLADDRTEVRVYSPVPGYYFGVSVAGATVGKEPQAPLTNSGVLGLSRLIGSNDMFTEADLNTMASGGTWIIEELGPNALFNRHQLTTDATSVEARELSIITAVDHVAKFVRTLVSPTIGVQNITPAFLSNLESTLNGAGDILTEEGVIQAFVVEEVLQDEIQPDTVRVTISLLPLYPVNFIRITLVF